MERCHHLISTFQRHQKQHLLNTAQISVLTVLIVQYFFYGHFLKMDLYDLERVCVWGRGGLNSDMCGMMWLHLIKNYLGIAIFNHLDVCIPIIVCELYYHLIQYSFMIYSVILNITSVSKNTFLWQILMTNLWKSPLEKNQNMSRLKLYWMFVHITQDN